MRGNESRGGGRAPARYLAAALLAIPVGILVWIQLLYLAFGITGGDPTRAITLAAFLLAFGPALAWPLYRTRRAAEVVRRSCLLGIGGALSLPVVAVTVLWIWEHAPNRPDLGMGGLLLYNLPILAFGMTLVLVAVFGLGVRWASRLNTNSSRSCNDSEGYS